MNILILNTSYNRPFSCLVCAGDENKAFFYEDCKSIKHSEDTLRTIDKFLTDASISLKDVDVIAVNLGPGSFTGIRVGVALAKGFACADPNKKLVAFNSMEQIAQCLNSDNVLLKANNDEFYYGKVEDGKFSIGIVETSSAKGDEYTDETNFNNMIDASIKVVLNKIDKGEFVSVNELNPIYLKLSQAERELLKRENNGNN